MLRRTVLSSLAAWPVLAASQASPEAAPSSSDPQALANDVDLMREALLTLHPGLLRYNSLVQVEAGLAQLRQVMSHGADLRERYLALSRFLSTLRCGHSYANFFNQRRPVAQALFDRPTRLPFYFRWLGERMFITADARPFNANLSANERLQPGTQVLTINGMAVDRMYRELLPYGRVDGHNDNKARSQLSLNGRYRLEHFDIFHGLVQGAPPSGVHRLQLRLPDGQQREAEAPAMTMAERHAQNPPIPAADAPMWRWDIHPSGVAVLTMTSWAVYNSRWAWKPWLQERLDALHQDKALRGLVVDVRDNEGGLDCGDPIIERFAREDSQLPMQRRVRYVRTPAHLNPYLDTWDPSFRDWGDAAKRIDERFYELPSRATTLRPREPRIDKPLVVLINGANSSATFGFAERVRKARLGALVGEGTGGNLRGINGGAYFFVRLPASGLEFDLPLIGYFPPGDPPDAGLMPDHSAVPSVADLAAGRDVQMQRALALAAG